MCGGSKPSAPPPEPPKPVDTNVANRGTDSAAVASGSGLSSGKAPVSTSGGSSLGDSGGGATSSILGG